MSEPFFHIARQGAIIDKQPLQRIIELIETKVLQLSDNYWTTGMTEWSTLEELYKKAKNSESNPQKTEPEPEWMEPPAHMPSPWSKGEERVTKKQRDFLESFGVIVPENLTKYDASRWLDQLLNNEQALAQKGQIEANKISETIGKNYDEGKWAGGFKTPSGQQRYEYNSYMEDSEKSIEEALQEISELKENEDYSMSDADVILRAAKDRQKGNLDGAKEAMSFRAEYWMDIIKLSQSVNDEEGVIYYCDSLQTNPDLLISLVEHAKCIKIKPSKKLILETLKQLDAESPTWDEDSPELFLKRLGEL